MRIRFRTAAAVALTMTLAAGACGSDEPTSATKDTSRLEVMSWWTSGSEAAALNTLLTAFQQAHPGVRPVNAAAAESRRIARVDHMGHVPGRFAIRQPKLDAHFPFTLDLRRMP